MELKQGSLGPYLQDMSKRLQKHTQKKLEQQELMQLLSQISEALMQINARIENIENKLGI